MIEVERNSHRKVNLGSSVYECHLVPVAGFSATEVRKQAIKILESRLPVAHTRITNVPLNLVLLG